MLKLNKKGGEKLLSIWWFLVLIIIAAGIVIGTLVFYSSDVDIRAVEADVLSNRIVNCFIERGHLNTVVLNKDFGIFEKCGLNSNIFGKGSNFYFKIGVYNESKKLMRDEISGGQASFLADCKITADSSNGKGTKAVHYPICVTNEKVFLYYKNGEIAQGYVSVIAGSNQAGKRNFMGGT